MGWKKIKLRDWLNLIPLARSRHSFEVFLAAGDLIKHLVNDPKQLSLLP
jgi:hypothetical protein